MGICAYSNCKVTFFLYNTKKILILADWNIPNFGCIDTIEAMLLVRFYV